MSDQLNSAWKRLQAQTPLFFKKIRNIGKSLMATGTAALVPQIVPKVTVPPVIMAIGEHAIVVGFVMTLVASFACQDPADVNKP